MFNTLGQEIANPGRWWTLDGCDCGYNSNITVNSRDMNNLGPDSGVIGIDDVAERYLFANPDVRPIAYDNWGTCCTYANWPASIPEPETEKRYKIKHH